MCCCNSGLSLCPYTCLILTIDCMLLLLLYLCLSNNLIAFLIDSHNFVLKLPSLSKLPSQKVVIIIIMYLYMFIMYVHMYPLIPRAHTWLPMIVWAVLCCVLTTQPLDTTTASLYNKPHSCSSLNSLRTVVYITCFPVYQNETLCMFNSC